ncbi:prostate stem cell antigen [Tiliqua scincoides]|uniref:prostate stem cell antigen n=1 Tax=Tiliqua scincoides TaxID=71010 RepID=UPI003462E5ED
MKPVLIVVLAGSLLMQAVGSLKCYTCSTQISNKNCQSVTVCDNSAKFCKTDVISAAGIFNIISKECTSQCMPQYKDFTVGKKNTTCCGTDLCNISGTSSLRTSYVQVALAALASFACIFLKSGL